MTVSQPVLLLAAVHEHPAGAVTETVPVPLLDAALFDVGEIVYVHVTPAWLTVKL